MQQALVAPKAVDGKIARIKYYPKPQNWKKAHPINFLSNKICCYDRSWYSSSSWCISLRINAKFNDKLTVILQNLFNRLEEDESKIFVHSYLNNSIKY